MMTVDHDFHDDDNLTQYDNVTNYLRIIHVIYMQSPLNRLIQWKHFSDVSTIYNPCGSLAMQPKIITDHDKIDLSNDLFKKPLPAVFIHD